MNSLYDFIVKPIGESRYNNSKIHGMCEICNIKIASEVHHLQYQKQANTKGIINNEFHKNKKRRKDDDDSDAPSKLFGTRKYFIPLSTI